MKYVILLLMILGATSIASASELPTSQWKEVDGVTLHRLVSEGFRIVAVTSDDFTSGEQGSSGYTYFLQKDSKAFKCSETSIMITMKHTHSAWLFMCSKLVEPYVHK